MNSWNKFNAWTEYLNKLHYNFHTRQPGGRVTKTVRNKYHRTRQTRKVKSFQGKHSNYRNISKLKHRLPCHCTALQQLTTQIQLWRYMLEDNVLVPSSSLNSLVTAWQYGAANVNRQTEERQKAKAMCRGATDRIMKFSFSAFHLS